MRSRRSGQAGHIAALMLLLALPVSHATAAEVDPANDPRVREVARQVLCYCGCSSLSVADCTCGVASKERAKIQARLDAGATTDDVVAEWVALRGTGILIEPPRKGFPLLGWFLPGVLLLLAGGLLAMQVRRWSRVRPVAPVAGRSDRPAEDPRFLEQLRRDLEKLGP